MRRQIGSAAIPWRRPGAMSLLVAVLTLAMLLPACSDDPTLGGWERTWQETVAAVPPLPDIMVEDPGPICSSTLGMLREAAADLITAPNPDLARAFLAWSGFTESVFFECPPSSGRYAGFEASYQEMARLATEVEALLAFEHGVQDSG